MKVRDEFKEIVKEIKDNEKEFKMSPRALLNNFFYTKRTKGNCARIDNFLERNHLETDPYYRNAYMDMPTVLKHKEKAKSKAETDPVQRISILPSANKSPITISREATLSEAITLMMMNNYSQLPVLSGSRTLAGFISWESIGYGLTNGITSTNVKDFINPTLISLDYETPLLEAIKIVIDNDFVIVQKKDKAIMGIITLADISTQFLNLTEPFLLLEQIENLIRLILDGKFLMQEIKEFCNELNPENDVQYIDDLTFGQYIHFIERQENWDKLGLHIERTHFIKQLDIVREIRNDIMHFDPEGITSDQRQILVNMAKFLFDIMNMKNQ